MNAKVREAQIQKIPYMLIVGQKETGSGTVAVRMRSGKQMNAMKAGEFAAYLTDKISRKALDL
jgi:threonyl-tRNA synthetase